MTENKPESMVGQKIGEGKYTEHWSLDGHSYIEVPKWVIKQVQTIAVSEALTKVMEACEGMKKTICQHTPSDSCDTSCYPREQERDEEYNQAIDDILTLIKQALSAEQQDRV